MKIKEHPTHKEPIKPTPNGHGLGWIKDKKSIKNQLTPKSPKVKALYKKVMETELPDEVDNRQYASPIEDQGSLGSCTANAAVACIEATENKMYGEYKDASRLFIYYNTRHLIEGTSGDVGATVSGTFDSINDYGACTEDKFPYDVSKFEDKPSEEAYEDGKDYQTIDYLKITTLEEIKKFCANGYFMEFGFFVFDSFEYNISSDGIMPIPNMNRENLLGGHAIACHGYKVIDGNEYLIIKNSWGESFGDSGWFYMPVEYLDDIYSYYGSDYECVSDINVILEQEYMQDDEEDDDDGDDSSQNF